MSGYSPRGNAARVPFLYVISLDVVLSLACPFPKPFEHRLGQEVSRQPDMLQSRCRIVGGFAGGLPLIIIPLNSGRYFSIGSSSASLPWSTKIIATVAVTGFELEAIEYPLVNAEVTERFFEDDFALVPGAGKHRAQYGHRRPCAGLPVGDSGRDQSARVVGDRLDGGPGDFEYPWSLQMNQSALVRKRHQRNRGRWRSPRSPYKCWGIENTVRRRHVSLGFSRLSRSVVNSAKTPVDCENCPAYSLAARKPEDSGTNSGLSQQIPQFV